MQVVTPIANHQQAINLEALLREDEKLYTASVRNLSMSQG